jgi:hypothetical protein
MNRDWRVEVSLEFKSLIRGKRTTRFWKPDRISCGCSRINRQSCLRTSRCNSGVSGYSYGRSRRTDQFVLKSIIIGRHDRKEESEDTHSTEQMYRTPTPRQTKVGERPASESCQTHE